MNKTNTTKLALLAMAVIGITGCASTSNQTAARQPERKLGAVLFSEDFEAGLGRWTGQNGGPHSGITVLDPLASGRGNVLTFTKLGGGGDLFTRELFSNADGIEISFDYLGLPKPGSVVGDLGGFFGFRTPIAGLFFAGTQDTYAEGVTIRLIDDGAWHRVAYIFLGGSIYSFQLMIEDWDGSRGVAGDVFFDNIQVRTLPR